MLNQRRREYQKKYHAAYHKKHRAAMVARVSEWRKNNLERARRNTRERARVRRREDSVLREAQRLTAKQYRKTHPGHATRMHRSNIARHPEKYKAHLAVKSALYWGELVRPDHCEKCGLICKPTAHHPDYSKPLKVEWLCNPCHRKAHWID